MTILVVGGDSADVFRQRLSSDHGYVEHWSGRKTRDLVESIPQATDAVVVVLDRVSHGLVKKVRAEASCRGLPLFFQRRERQVHSTDHDQESLTQWLRKQ